MHAKSLQSCPTLCISPPGSSVHWILQARILEWIAISSSRGFPDPGIKPASPASPALQADSLPLSHGGSSDTNYRSFQKTEQDQKKLLKILCISFKAFSLCWSGNEQTLSRLSRLPSRKESACSAEKRELRVGSLHQEDTLKGKIATHYSILAWKIS